MTPSTRTVRGAVALAAGAALALLASACANVDVPESLPGPTTTTTAPSAPTPPVDCGNPVASLRPTAAGTGDIPPGSYMAEIQARGRLRVGVDTSTKQFSSVNPNTGEFEGFDVDIAREVAQALGLDIELVGIPNSERINALTTGETTGGPVDLVAHSFTINCVRRQDIAFSSEYFTAHQRVLVRSDDDAARVEDIGAREDGRVCVTAGSTAIDNINALDEPHPELVQVSARAECLVALQQGRVDGIVTDDAILAGNAAQDLENVKIVGPELSDEPYGLGLPPDRPEWVRYVNAVLEDVRESGRWGQLYDQWLAGILLDPGESAPSPPAPVYED